MRSSSPVARSIPNSNFVSARMIPAALGDRRAVAVQRDRDVADPLGAIVARRRAAPTIGRSRCSRRARPPRPSSPGVKIGSGSRSLSRRPAGSAMPQTAPVRQVLLPAGAREVAADDRPRSGGRRPGGRASSGRAARGTRPGPRPSRREVLGRGREEVVRHDRLGLWRTRTATGRSARGPCRGSRSAGRRRTRDTGPTRRAAAGPSADARTGRGPCRSGRTSRRSS